MIGPRHPSVQRLRRLSRRRSARSDENAFVIDGPTLLAEALAAGVQLLEVVAEPGADEELLARVDVTIHRAAEGTLAKAVDPVTPQGIAAIAAIPPSTISANRRDRLVVVAVGVNDPGNAGTLLRSADAAGVDLVAFCDDSVDPYNPKCVRAAAGSLFRLPVIRSAGSLETLKDLKAAGIRSLGTVARGGSVYDTVDYAVPSAVVLGSEAHGLAPEVISAVDELVTIPMSGPTESLNVGMAGTIVVFEALRQRRARRNEVDGTPSPGAGFSGS